MTRGKEHINLQGLSFLALTVAQWMTGISVGRATPLHNAKLKKCSEQHLEFD